MWVMHVGLVHMMLDIVDTIFTPKITLSMTYWPEEVISRHHEFVSNGILNSLFITLQKYATQVHVCIIGA